MFFPFKITTHTSQRRNPHLLPNNNKETPNQNPHYETALKAKKSPQKSSTQTQATNQSKSNMGENVYLRT